MKYLLVLLVVLVAYALWKHNRRVPPPARRVAAPQPMVACAHCGAHVAAHEAVRDAQHSYCCAEHQRLGPALPR